MGSGEGLEEVSTFLRKLSCVASGMLRVDFRYASAITVSPSPKGLLRSRGDDRYQGRRLGIDVVDVKATPVFSYRKVM